MLGLVGKKIGMTQFFDEKGQWLPVTVVNAGPCVVVQVKTGTTDGYDAIQVGFDEQPKLNRVTRPLKGRFTKAGTKAFKVLREFRVADASPFKVGQILDVGLFRKGDLVDVCGVTLGFGFQGVMKRHGKAGGPGAHGSHFHRSTGSIGMRTWPGRVLKNTGLPGQMGSANRTVKNLKVVDVDLDQHVILIKGSIPGFKSGIVSLTNLASDFAARIAKGADAPPAEEHKPD